MSRPIGVALILLMTANGLPWMAGRLFHGRWSAPLDFGLTVGGHRLFGSHKTWRGLFTAAVACTAVGTFLQASWWVGGLFGVLSMLGDALSSAIKRRLEYPPGTDILLLDQLPEALVPLIVLSGPLGLEVAQIAIVAAVFVLLDALTARVRHGVGLRRRASTQRE